MGTEDLVLHVSMWYLCFDFPKSRLPPCHPLGSTLQIGPCYLLSWLSSPTQKVPSKPKPQSLISLVEQHALHGAALLRGL